MVIKGFEINYGFYRYIISCIYKIHNFSINTVNTTLYDFLMVIKYSFIFSILTLLDIVCVDGITHNFKRFEVVYIFSDYNRNFRYFFKRRNKKGRKLISIKDLYSSSG